MKQLLLFKIMDYPRDMLWDYYYYADRRVLTILIPFNQGFDNNGDIKAHLGTYEEIASVCLELWGWYDLAPDSFFNIYIELFNYTEMISDS